MTRYFFAIPLIAALCGLSQAASVTYTKGSSGSGQFRNPCKVILQADPAFSYSKTLFLNQQSYAFPVQAKPAQGWKAVSAKYLTDFTPGSEVTIDLGNSLTPVSFQLPTRLLPTANYLPIVTVRFATMRRNPDGSPEHQEDILVYAKVVPSIDNMDTDGDNLPDIWEQAYGLDLNSPTDGGNMDSDQDGLSNWDEYTTGTNPNMWDTDGDEIADANDRNPLIQNPSIPWGFYAIISDLEVNNPDYDNIDSTKIELRWQPSSHNPTGYRLERRVESEDWQQIASLSAGTTQYSVQNLLANQHYQYRLTAYREVNGQQILSDPGFIDHEVPVLLNFDAKQSQLAKSKTGFTEFTSPSSPPKYYRVKTTDLSWSYTYSTPNQDMNKANTYLFVKTFDPAAHKVTSHGEYSETYSNQNHDGAYISNSQSTTSSTYDWVEQNRAKGALTATTSGSMSYNQSASSSSSWPIFGGHPAGSSSSSTQIQESGTHLYTSTYVPNNNPPIWGGIDFDSDNGSLTYAGNSAYGYHYSYNYNSSVDGASSNTSNITKNSTVNPDGSWTGTSTTNGTTQSWPAAAWNGSWNPTGTYGALANQTPTQKNYSSSGGGYSYSGSDTLSQEYTTPDFVADVVNDLPDYPNGWEKHWSGEDSDNFPMVFPSYDPKALRHLANNEMHFEAKKYKYKMKASPSVPYTLRWNEVLVPDNDPNTPVDESKDIQVIRQRSWTLGGSTNTSPEFEVADATTSTVKGTYSLLPIKVTFLTADGNSSLQDNKYPSTWSDGFPIGSTWMPGKGQRVFPDAWEPNDNQPRDEVNVLVQVGLPNKNVYLKVIDVDDPTPPKYDIDSNTQQHIVDPNDQGGEKGGDNTGTPAKFTSSNSDEVDCVTDAYGYAKVGNDLPRLKVGMRAGDNYRVAVAFKKSDLGMLQVTNKAGSGYVPAGSESVEGFKGDISPMLTVWRKINLEIDTMNKITQPKGAPDRTTFSNAHWVSSDTLSGIAQPATGDISENFYEGGYIQEGNNKIRITSSTSIYHPGSIEVRLQFEQHPNIAEGSSFVAYDDDDRFLDILGLNPPLPKTNQHAKIVQALQPLYSPAYIEVVDADALNTNKILNFELNSHPVLPIGPQFDYNYLASKRDLPKSTNSFWSWLVVIVYQGPIDHDADPNSELENGGLLLGETLPGTNVLMPEKLSVVPYEVNRDLALEWKNDLYLNTESHKESTRQELDARFFGTIAHEIGHNHSAVNDHIENGPQEVDNGIMQYGGLSLDSPYAYFRSHTILRFRTNTVW